MCRIQGGLFGMAIVGDISRYLPSPMDEGKTRGMPTHRHSADMSGLYQLDDVVTP